MLVECELSLFAIEGTRDYGLRVAQHLELVLDEHEERAFEDGEHKIRPLVNVRRHDVFVIQSLYADTEQSPTTSSADSFSLSGAQECRRRARHRRRSLSLLSPQGPARAAARPNHD